MAKRPALIAATLLALATTLATVAPGRAAEVARVRSAYPDMPAATLLGLRDRAERLYPKLSAFFGKDLTLPITIDVNDRYRISKAFPDRNLIGLTRFVLDEHIAPMAHEMTHLFMPERKSVALSEGIAIYVQDRFGETGGFPNFGKDLDAVLVPRLKDAPVDAVRSFAAADMFLSRSPGWAAYRGRGARQTAYLVAGSFVRYLFDVELGGDMTKFRRLYVSEDFKGVTGKTLAALDAAWQRHIGLTTG